MAANEPIEMAAPVEENQSDFLLDICECTEAERAYWEDRELEAREHIAAIDAKTAAIEGPLGVLIDQFKKWLVIPDIDLPVLEFVLALYKSHDPEYADPLWGIVIGPSGGGKSEYLRTLLDSPKVFHLSNATPKSLASGYRIKGKKGQPDIDPSLLPQMDQKIVVIPDLAPLLEQRPESRNEVFSILRDGYDGTYVDGKGNQPTTIKHKSVFTLLTAATSKIDEHSAEMAALGARFVQIRMRGKEGLRKCLQASRNALLQKQMREELKEAVKQFFPKLGNMAEVVVSEAIEVKIAEIADFTATARSPISRNRYSREIEAHPALEEGGRLTVQFGKLIRAVALVRGRKIATAADVALIQRVAEDCLPPFRQEIIQCLQADPAKEWTVGELAKAMGYHRNVVAREVEELQMLKIVDSKIVKIDKTEHEVFCAAPRKSFNQ